MKRLPKLFTWKVRFTALSATAIMRSRQRSYVSTVVLLLLLTACSFGPEAAPTAESYRPIRSPYPTFTPTAVGAEVAAAPTTAPLAQPNAAAETPIAPPLPTDTPPPAPSATLTPTVAPTVAPTAAPPQVVINSPLVNLRTGPGVNYALLGTAERGEEFDIVGKNAAGDWWRVCCVDEQPGWVIDELVETSGAVDTVPVSDAVAEAPPTATSAPAAPVAPAATTAPAEPTPTTAPAAPSFSFTLVGQEQFPEPKLVRVFLYVYENDRALAGYTLRVRKDGAELPVTATSAAGQSLSWPIADARQRFQNMKVEFPGIAAAGTWEVQLFDSSGNAVGPAATFALEGNEPDQELYVRYKKN